MASPTIIVKNPSTTTAVLLQEFGIRSIAASGQVNLSEKDIPIWRIYRAAQKTGTGQFGALISAGTVVINNGTSDLSSSDAANFLSEFNRDDVVAAAIAAAGGANATNAIYVSNGGNNSNSGQNPGSPVQTLDNAITKAAALSGTDKWVVCLDGSVLTTALSSFAAGTNIFAPKATLNSNIVGPASGDIFVRFFRQAGTISVGAGSVIALNEHASGFGTGNITLQAVSHDSILDIGDLQAGTITTTGATGTTGLFVRKTHSSSILTGTGTVTPYGYIGAQLLGTIASTKVTGNFEQNKITGLHDELIVKADSPLTTVQGRFPRYGDTQGDLDEGVEQTGVGKVVTLNSHNVIDDQFLPERNRRYPNLPNSGYTTSATISPGNASTYLGRFNIFDGSISSSVGLSVTFSDAAALPAKSDFSNDDDTIVIANFNRLPVRLAIIPGSQVWRLNTGTISGDIDLPQFHFIQLSRLSGFSSQIYVMNFGIVNFRSW